MTRPRIVVATAGHLATCPRMLKAADALHAAGCDVHVISCVFEPWARAADHALKREPWRWTTVRYDSGAAVARIVTGIRQRAGQLAASRCGPDRVPFHVVTRAFSRAHSELVSAIVQASPEFIYGGTTGALAATAEAARRCGVAYGLDLEDFYSDERPGEALAHQLASRVERRVLGEAAVLTASTAQIADAYRQAYGVSAVPIHNTFALPPKPPDCRAAARPFRLYWFSQTIGPGRGLDDVIRAAGLLKNEIALDLRGKADPRYVEALRDLQRRSAPNLRVTIERPAMPDDMVRLCASCHAGLSPEQPVTRNRDLCLANKIFTYLLAGRPVVLTDTTAHRALAADLGDAAFVYRPGDVSALAAGLSRWIEDPKVAERARRAAWAAACRRWHWEHPLDRGALVDSILRTVGAVAVA